MGNERFTAWGVSFAPAMKFLRLAILTSAAVCAYAHKESLCSFEAGSLAWLHKQESFAFPLIAFPDCFSAVQLSRCAGSGFSPITRSGYHRLSGLSFNPWFDFSSRRKGCLFVSAGGKHGRKCIPEALKNHRVHRLFASCAAAAGRSHSITASESSQTIFTMISRFSRSTHRPWRVP